MDCSSRCSLPQHRTSDLPHQICSSRVELPLSTVPAASITAFIDMSTTNKENKEAFAQENTAGTYTHYLFLSLLLTTVSLDQEPSHDPANLPSEVHGDQSELHISTSSIPDQATHMSKINSYLLISDTKVAIFKKHLDTPQSP